VRYRYDEQKKKRYKKSFLLVVMGKGHRSDGSVAVGGWLSTDGLIAGGGPSSPGNKRNRAEVWRPGHRLEGGFA